MRSNYDSNVGSVSDSATRISSDGLIRPDTIGPGIGFIDLDRALYRLQSTNTVSPTRLIPFGKVTRCRDQYRICILVDENVKNNNAIVIDNS